MTSPPIPTPLGPGATATSPIYPASSTLAENTALKAKAFKPDFQPSATLTEVYTLEQVKPPAPVSLPPGQEFEVFVSVGLL